MTHICVGNPTNIDSDNGLSPGRRQAIIWTNAGLLLIGPLGTNFSEILSEIRSFSFKKTHLKMSSAKWRLSRLGLNVLTVKSYFAPMHTLHISSSRVSYNSVLIYLQKVESVLSGPDQNLYHCEILVTNAKQAGTFDDVIQRTAGACNVVRHRIPELKLEFSVNLMGKVRTYSISTFVSHIMSYRPCLLFYLPY